MCNQIINKPEDTNLRSLSNPCLKLYLAKAAVLLGAVFGLAGIYRDAAVNKAHATPNTEKR